MDRRNAHQTHQTSDKSSSTYLFIRIHCIGSKEGEITQYHDGRTVRNRLTHRFSEFISSISDSLTVKRFDLTPVRVNFQTGEDSVDVETTPAAKPSLLIDAIYDKNGARISTVTEFATAVAQILDMSDPTFGNANEEHTFLTVERDLTTNELELELYLRRAGTENSDMLEIILNYEIVYEIRVQVRPAPLKYGEIFNAGFAHGVAVFPTEEIEIIATETANGTRSLAARHKSRGD